MHHWVINRLKGWGLWPAFVMVFAQYEACHLLGFQLPHSIALATFVGTLLMYGADRVVERLWQRQVEKRHGASSIDPWIFLGLCLVLGFKILELHQFFANFVILGMLGCLYLLITTGKLRSYYILKEFLGATTFSYLVWGWWFPYHSFLPLLAFWMMGYSNFLVESEQDSARDAVNGLETIAVLNPLVNNRLRVSLAGAALCLFCISPVLSLPFIGVSLGHVFWPKKKAGIDLVFACLLVRPLGSLFNLA